MYRNRNKGGDGDSAMILVLILVLVLIIGGFAWWYVTTSKTTPPAPVQQTPIVEAPVAFTQTAPTTSSTTTSGSGKFEGPLDMIGSYRTEALGVYSVRSVYSGYSGPILRVRRSATAGAGQEESFFQKEKDGPLVTMGGKTVAEFLGAGNAGVITIWFDQSGKGRHITMRSGWPRIWEETAGSNADKYYLKFDNTRMSFDDDGEKDTRIALSNYRNLTIVANENIFVGPMENRVMRGDLTDVYFFKSVVGTAQLQSLQRSKKFPLKIVSTPGDVSEAGESRIRVDPDSRDVTVINNTKKPFGVFLKTPAGTKQVVRASVPGNGQTTVLRNVNGVMPGATLYIGLTKDANPIAQVVIPATVVKGLLDGDLAAKKLYVKNLQPSTAVVNIYERNANGSIAPNPIHSNIKQSDSNKAYSVPSMKRGSRYIIGPTKDVEVSSWTA